MPHQNPVDIVSDSDSDSNRRAYLVCDAIDLITPPSFPHSKKKKLRTEALSNPSISSTVLIIDDDPTPRKQQLSSTEPTLSATPSFVAETPFSDASLVRCSRMKFSSFSGLAADKLVVADTPISELSKSEASIVKCNSGVRLLHATEEFHPANTTEKPAYCLTSKHKAIGLDGLICVESDNESENYGVAGTWKHGDAFYAETVTEAKLDPRIVESSLVTGTSIELHKRLSMDDADKIQILDGCSGPYLSEGDASLNDNEVYKEEEFKAKRPLQSKRMSKEERLRLMEERKLQKERERLHKAASKAEAAEMKKRQKEMQKWEKGKYALKSIVAEIDRRVVEMGSIGGHLLTRFAEKGLSYRITSNPVDRSVVWTMVFPQGISPTSSEPIEISYVLIIYEAEDFCNMVVNGSLLDHVQSVRHHYPHHTICYLTNRLMAYINKREQAQYKNPSGNTSWKRPAIEEALATLATHFFEVHSRQCVDEAEIAEHVVGLTCSLASCQFRKRLTRLSVNANGSVIPKDCVDKNLIKKSLWLKVLVAIPKVQPRFAVAIWKKYPTMKSLLHVYMDPTKSVHEKEFLLKDLATEGLFGDDRRVGEICSKRIYRILMAQRGSIKTDDVENGADFFTHLSA